MPFVDVPLVPEKITDDGDPDPPCKCLLAFVVLIAPNDVPSIVGPFS